MRRLGPTLLLFCCLFGCGRRDAQYQRPAVVDSLDGAPPAPDFYNPVDYVAWMDRRSGRGKTPNDVHIYDGFWRIPIHQPGGNVRFVEGMPVPSDRADALLEELVAGSLWRPGQHAELEAYLVETKAHMTVFRNATGRPRFWFRPQADFEDPYNPVGVLLPRLRSSRDAVRIVLVESWREGPRQVPRMFEAWKQALKHADHLQSNGLWMFARPATEARMLVYRAMRAASAQKILDADACQAALSTLLASETRQSRMGDVILMEWGGALGFLQSLYPKRRLDTSRAAVYAELDVGELAASPVAPATLAAAADAYFSELMTVAKKPPSAAWIIEVGKIEAKHDTPPMSTHPLRPFALMSMMRFFRDQLKEEAAYRATTVVLMLRQYYCRHGQWPASLDQLATDDRAEVLIDPFYGGSFIYRKTQGLPVLYSVGEDAFDTGGRHRHWEYDSPFEPGYDIVYWPVQDVGEDKHTP